VEEHLSSKFKALDSIPSRAKNKKKKTTVAPSVTLTIMGITLLL
jgi:hypothetical protein